MKIKLCSLSLSISQWLALCPKTPPFLCKNLCLLPKHMSLPSLSTYTNATIPFLLLSPLIHLSHSYSLTYYHSANNYLLPHLPSGFGFSTFCATPFNTPWYSRILTFGVFGLSFLYLIAIFKSFQVFSFSSHSLSGTLFYVCV